MSMKKDYPVAAQKFKRHIADLEQQNAELIRKGEGLCSAYGNELIKTHDLEQKLTDLRTAVYHHCFEDSQKSHNELRAALERSRQ